LPAGQPGQRDAAFTDVRFELIVAEVGIVTGARPR
jgi:hypothetical protein